MQRLYREGRNVDHAVKFEKKRLGQNQRVAAQSVAKMVE